MKLARKVLDGDVKAAARLISQIEDESPDALEEMDSIYPHTGGAHIVGVTGPPGAGKSTLIDSLIYSFRNKRRSVGVIAIDPTSALTGGAILGDRIRMQWHSGDKGVFIRSLATRGWVGGLARATIGTIHVMDALGKDVILVETVGSGQIEIDIVRATDTTIVVLTPGAGDEIQMMKAGILEAVDIFVINKIDRGGADHLRTDLEAMLMMKDNKVDEWPPAIVLTEAIHDKGTEELMQAILAHKEFLVSSGGMQIRRRERARLELIEATEGLIKDSINKIDRGDYLERLVDKLVEGKTNPRRAALEIARRLTIGSNKPEHRGKDGL